MDGAEDGDAGLPADASRVPLPAGLVAVPAHGAGAVGALLKRPARWWLWVKGAAWAAGAVLGVSLAVRNAASPWGVALALLITAVCAVMAGGDLALAVRGGRPVLVVDATDLHVLVFFSRVSVRLSAITRIRVYRRDMVITAPGGIAHRGRPGRARSTSLGNLRVLEVTGEDLAGYLSARADAAGAPR